MGSVKVKDLTIDEFKSLISTTVKETMEDMLALSSGKYLESIKEARRDYKEGRVKPFEEISGA